VREPAYSEILERLRNPSVASNFSGAENAARRRRWFSVHAGPIPFLRDVVAHRGGPNCRIPGDSGVSGIEFVKADLASMREAERVGKTLPVESLDLVAFTTEWIIGLLTPSPEAYAERITPLLVSPDLEGHSGAMFDSNGTASEALVSRTGVRLS
jgi:hypothetical protein